MNMTPVLSSTLSVVGYDPATGSLELRFKSRAVYRYSNVPPHRYAGLMNAPSKGSYFNAYIKEHYRYHKIR